MFRAPTGAGLPPVAMMVDAIAARPDQIARHLGISMRTLRRYITHDTAPRAIRLALFWETRWGRSAADEEAARFGAVNHAYAMSLKQHQAALLAHIAQLEAERGQVEGLAANTPFYAPGAPKKKPPGLPLTA